MDQLLDIIKLKNSNANEETLSRTMLRDNYPFQIRDMSVLQCNTDSV